MPALLSQPLPAVLIPLDHTDWDPGREPGEHAWWHKKKSVLTAMLFPLGRLVGLLTFQVSTSAPELMYLLHKASFTVLFTF